MKNKNFMSKAGYIKWIEDISFFYQKSMSLPKGGKAVWTRGLLITNTLQEPSTRDYQLQLFIDRLLSNLQSNKTNSI